MNGHKVLKRYKIRIFSSKHVFLLFQIKGVIIDDDELLIQVENDYKKQIKLGEPLTFNIFKKDNSIDELSSIFHSQYTYSHLLIDFLLKLESNSTDKSELFSLCRDEYRNDTTELKILHDFQHKYSSENPLWWYSLDAFPYKMLNKALRTRNIHLLYLYRFFMKDIYEQLHKQQCRTAVHVYRGQCITNDELKVFKDSIGQMLSMNSFLSTSLNRNKALEFIEENQSANNDLQKVLFKIDADPAHDTTKPFANISQYSVYGDEREILFSMNSVFRLISVHRGKNQMWIIRMTLCDDNEEHLKSVYDYITTRYHNKQINHLLFCEILSEMKRFPEAEIYNRRFLQMSPRNRSELSTCYFNLGCLYSKKNDYDSSLDWHQQSLDIRLSLARSNNLDLSESYSQIGFIYEKKEDYQQALENHNNALYSSKQINRKSDQHIITCYINLGRIKQKMRKYSDALHDYKKALAIRKKHLSTDDFDLGLLYHDIGYVHGRFTEFDRALEYYSLALQTYEKCLPTEHLKVASVLLKMGYGYEDKGLLTQALIYYEKTAGIYRVLFSEGHPDLNKIEEDIRQITSKLKDYETINENK
jgi:tetratricopeptide (TPR) repeat protein